MNSCGSFVVGSTSGSTDDRSNSIEDERGPIPNTVNLHNIKPEVRPYEEINRGETWSERDTRLLIEVWGDPDIQKQLRGVLRNNVVYDEICRRLREHGVYRTPAQCRNKTKNLRKGFRELKLRSGGDLGRCSKSITRQSSLFYKELDQVWGQDFLNNPSEFESPEGPSQYKDSDDSTGLYDSPGIGGTSHANSSDVRMYELHDGTQGEDHSKDHSSNSYVFSPRPVVGGYVVRDRLEPVIAAIQHANQDNMEKVRETVLELNRTFLEQQSAAEERRDKLIKEHEIRLFEMFLNRSGNFQVPVYPVRLSESGNKNYSQPDALQGHTQRLSHTQPPPPPPPPPEASPSDGAGHGLPSKRLRHNQDQNPVRLDKPASVGHLSSPLTRLSSATVPAVFPSSMHCLALRLHPGDDIKECLKQLMEERNIQAACIVSCVGSVRCAELRLADSKSTLKLNSNHEIVSLVGTLSTGGMHLHASLSDEDGKVVGGHVFGSMEVFTTAEIVIGELPGVRFKREIDQETGYRELVLEPEGDAL